MELKEGSLRCFYSKTFSDSGRIANTSTGMMRRERTWTGALEPPSVET
jgi:hypothetical protein